jgi:hypothetical protein
MVLSSQWGMNFQNSEFFKNSEFWNKKPRRAERAGAE